MLAHKVDGEHPARYSDLLLAAQKLERLAEARDLLLLKVTSMEGIECDSFSYIRELVSILEVEGWS